MSALKSKLPIVTTLSFLCLLVFTIPVSAGPGSGRTVDLQGTDSAGSFRHDGQGHCGIAIAARMPMIAITISSSMSVKPFAVL